MHPALVRYVAALPHAGEVAAGAVHLLSACGREDTAEHCRRVAAQAAALARRYAVDEVRAGTAGWLHDISAIVPDPDRLHLSEMLGLEVLSEERDVPMLLHQKLSAVIAAEVFSIADPAVLSAIGCHTTLKPQSTRLDRVVFVADKIAWDQPGDPPYLDPILSAVDRSLDRAAHCYLDYLWQRRETLPALHPWAAAAYEELSARFRQEG